MIKIPSIDDLSRWIRNQKDSKIKEILRHIPNHDFDSSNVRVQFVDGLGTAYIKTIDDQAFHINKCDEHGNTLMHVAAQNGNTKIAMFLVTKGANPNHQNKQGQTPGHFALSYQFYDFASWLFDPEGGKGNDLLTNIYGLGPYDGLTDD